MRCARHGGGRQASSAPIGLAVALAALCAGAVQAATVRLEVANVKRPAGHVRAALCSQASFLQSDCAYAASAPARVGQTVVTFDGVAPGRYAAQVFDDDTDGQRVHQDRLGVPREGVGFSNDAPIHMNGPRFNDAAFDVGERGAPTVVHVTLRYFSARSQPSGGPGSPP